MRQNTNWRALLGLATLSAAAIVCTRPVDSSLTPQATLSDDQQSRLEVTQTAIARVSPTPSATPNPSPTPTLTVTSSPTLLLTITPIPFTDILSDEDQKTAQEVVDSHLATECTKIPYDRKFCPNDSWLKRDQILAAVTFCNAIEKVEIGEPIGFTVGWWVDLDRNDTDDRDYAASLEYLLYIGFKAFEISPGGTTYARPERPVTDVQDSYFLDRVLEICPVTNDSGGDQ